MGRDRSKPLKTRLLSLSKHRAIISLLKHRPLPFDKLKSRRNRYSVVDFGFFTGVLGAFVLPALLVPATGFLTAGFLAVPVGFVEDRVPGLAAGLLVDLGAGLAVVTVLVFFAVDVEDFTAGLAAPLLTAAGLAEAFFGFTAVLAAFWVGVFATISVFTAAAFAVTFVFLAALLAVLAVLSLFALSAIVLFDAAAARFLPG